MSRVWGDELDAFMSSSSSTLGPYDDLPARADVIIVLDNSYSMRGRLQRGKAILRYNVFGAFPFAVASLVGLHDLAADTSDRFSPGTNVSRSHSEAA